MQDLKATLVETDLVWENITVNAERISSLIEKNIAETDLIILPEMFTTGFTMRPELFYEEPYGKTFEWMKRLASRHQALVLGSYIIREGGHYYNRLHAVTGSELLGTYDKKHLFRMGKEHESYESGTKQLIINYKGWSIMPLICYDLRFPVWSRNKLTNSKQSYDLLVYVANWPQRRSLQWQRLLVSRAIENQCYVIGVNRIGNDGNNVPHSGNSVALDYFGEEISQPTQSVQTVSFSISALNQYRKDFPAWQDADEFSIL